MARFLKRFVIFLIPVILVALSLEIYLKNRTSQNEILAKLALVEENEDATLIFVGNSHGRNAFIPNIFEQESLNLCIGGSTSFYNLKLLENVLEKLPKLKHIVYNISYQTLYYDLDSLPNKQKSYEFYHYLKADAGVNKYSSEYISILSTIGVKKAIKNCINDIGTKEATLLETKGYKKQTKEISFEEIKQSAINRIGNHHRLMNPNKLSYNLNQLEAIETLATKHDIQMVYVILPVIESYKFAIENPFDSYTLLSQKLAIEHNQKFYNLSDSLELDYSHFVDPDHVNEKGAKVISNYLSQALKNDFKNEK